MKKLWIVILIALAAVIFYIMIQRFLPNFYYATRSEIFDLKEEQSMVVMVEDQSIILDYEPVFVEDNLYLPIDLVTSYIEPYYFWDEEEGVLSYTDESQVIRMKPDSRVYSINQQTYEIDNPLLLDETLYIPISIVEGLTPMIARYFPGNNLVVIDFTDRVYKTGDIARRSTYIRMDKDEKSKIVEKVEKHHTVRLYEESQGWYKVRSESGMLGYIREKDIIHVTMHYPKTTQLEDKNPLHTLEANKKINMVWHQVTVKAANKNVENIINPSYSLDVLSPTWFELKNEEGEIRDIADKDYVTWAHQQGYEVWALFSNSFNSGLTHEVLSRTSLRDKVIHRIMELVTTYNIDGLNIDFENVAKEDGAYFVQFVREITPYLKAKNITVSVDMYVPTEWTKHYNRAELGKVIDYLIIMAYDEHWSTSPVSGSVASMGFVEQGIIDTLKEVPKEKVILGVPFYTRLWKEEKKGSEIKVSSKAYSMSKGLAILKENNAEIIWDETVGQYYGSYTKENVTYKLWAEEERSMEQRLQLMVDYDLAGVSGWKIGLEKDEIWPVFQRYLN